MNPITGGQMRIAMLSAHSCPVGRLGTKDTGGMSVYVLELARELGKSGHLVDIYTRVHDSEDRQIYELGRNVRLMHLKAGKGGELHQLAVYAPLREFTREQSLLALRPRGKTIVSMVGCASPDNVPYPRRGEKYHRDW